MESLGLGRKRSGYVRPFAENDIAQVADLHRRVFRAGGPPSPQLERSYASYFNKIFFHHPWRDPTLPSLVYEEAGRIIGFLGVMPRRMVMDARPIQAAISSQFIVEPGGRSTLAAIQLLKAFTSGPQDLSLSDEANGMSRKLWEGLGGPTALLYSLCWGRLLQPSQFILSRFKKNGSPVSVAQVSRPLCRVIDALAARLPQSPFRQVVPSVSGEELDGETLLRCLSEFSGGRFLRPEYDRYSLDWLLSILEEKKSHGAFVKVAVRNGSREIVGWYLSYFKRGGIGEVVQIGARKDSIQAVLTHLFYHAWQQGVVALAGRLEPRFIDELREQNCLFYHRGDWMLLHSNKPELLGAIQRGDAFLTRLEGEWCMRFHDDRHPSDSLV